MAGSTKKAKKAAQKEAVKESSLSLRINSDVKANIEAAARLSGLSVSDFVVSAAAKAASQILRDQHVLHLSEKAFTRFLDAVEEETPPDESALETARRLKAKKHAVNKPGLHAE